MEETLRQLFALQQIDAHLDELEEMKGDLPTEVNVLETKVQGLKTQLATLEQTMRDTFALRDTTDSDIISFKEKVERYKSQQYEVRTNRQYDALTREMDSAVATIARLEKEMEALEGKAVVARADIETTKAQLDDMVNALEEKRQALAELSKATEAEELQYRHQRENVVVRIRKADLATYERIRKAKRGQAVVRVVRGACGGCFNKVPPQKLLELRQSHKMFMCEHCGRILVSDEIAEGKTTPA